MQNMNLAGPVARAFLILAWFGGLSSAAAQVPAGYYLGEPVSLPDSLVETHHDGRFTLRVVRTAANEAERDLIVRAERLFPEASRIQAAANAHVLSGNWNSARPNPVVEAAALPGQRWWWREWDPVLLPYALTGAAAEHYITKLRELSAGPNPFAQHNPGVQHRASLEYTARVARSGTGTTVHLRMQWSFSCGSLCALRFSHEREVVFDATGNITAVRGDRPPSIVVS